MTQKIRLAIVSDLHCHRKYDASDKDKTNETYLFSDALRNSDHPIDSLENKLKGEKVDLVFCPGDYTNKSDQLGFVSGWGFVTEIRDFLNAEEIIGTLGNHDLDSYNTYSSYSFTTAKGIKRNFPFKDEVQRDLFWSKGCVFIERDCCRILVINSCHYHHNKANAGHGKIDDDMLVYIKDHLKTNTEKKINIALMHHPPINHSRLDLGEDDIIIKADDLLNILGEFEFDLVIHGHKHDPLIRYYTTTEGSYRLPIFSSGSFSATANIIYCGMKNFFHIVDIEKSEETVKGEILSWTYIPRVGWEFNYEQNAFPPFSGFGNKMPLDEIVQKIEENVNSLTQWSDVEEKVPNVRNLIPEEHKAVREKLLRKGIYTDKALSDFPNVIFK